MMKLKTMIVGLLSVILLAACGTKETTPTEEETPLASPVVEQGETDDIKALVAEYSVGEFTDETASITSEELIVTDKNDKKTVYPLPADEFFVSIAPFLEQTHPCDIHSLTGCQGELVEESFDVYIANMDGEVILDETVQTAKNGFIDLWLPKNESYQIKITQDGKTVESTLSTNENDPTCITTLQLT